MRNILEEFARRMFADEHGYIGEDFPCDFTTEDLSDIEDKLMSLLDGETKNLFRQFVLVQAKAELQTGVDRFIYGYRLGVLLTMEVINSKDKLFVSKGGE